MGQQSQKQNLENSHDVSSRQQPRSLQSPMPVDSQNRLKASIPRLHDEAGNRAASRFAESNPPQCIPIDDSNPAAVQKGLRTSSKPLDSSIRSYMESRFGNDLMGVRVHTGLRAAMSASAVGADAYTVGQDLVFGPGQYSPYTSQGRRLLAHELAHVIQQKRGGEQGNDGSNSHESNLETEAERAALTVDAGQTVQVVGRTTPMLQRHCTERPRCAGRSFTTAQNEVRCLIYYLCRQRNPTNRAWALSRFLSFSMDQINAIAEAWSQRMPDLIFHVEQRAGRDWADAVRNRLRIAQEHRTQVESERHRQESTERRQQRVREHYESERQLVEESEPEARERVTPLARHLLRQHESLSEEQRQAVQEWLYFISSQPDVELPNGRVLRPGHQYRWAQNRWFLGRRHRTTGPLVWGSPDFINGEIYLSVEQSLMEQIHQAGAEAGQSARIWIPIGLAVAIACTAVLAVTAAPALVAVPAQALVETGAVGVVVSRAAYATIRFGITNYGLIGGAGYTGRQFYIYYMQNPHVVNQAFMEAVDISFNFAGMDTGPVSPGDIINFPVRIGRRGYQIVEATVTHVDEANHTVRAVGRARSATHEQVISEFGSDSVVRRSTLAPTEPSAPSSRMSGAEETPGASRPPASEPRGPEGTTRPLEPSPRSIHAPESAPQPSQVGMELQEGGGTTGVPSGTGGDTRVAASAIRGSSRSASSIEFIQRGNNRLRPQIRSILSQEYGEDVFQNYDYVIVGLPESEVSTFSVIPTGELFAARSTDPGVAEYFARRAVGGRTGQGEIGGVILVFERGEVDLRRITRAIGDIPDQYEVVFSGISLERLARFADVLPLPRGFFSQ